MRLCFKLLIFKFYENRLISSSYAALDSPSVSVAYLSITDLPFSRLIKSGNLNYCIMECALARSLRVSSTCGQCEFTLGLAIVRI